MKDINNLTIQLKYWRIRQGKSIRDLASEAHVSSATISRIERGELTMPRSDVLERLAANLGIPLDELVIDKSEVS